MHVLRHIIRHLLENVLNEWYMPVNPGTQLKSVRTFRPVYHGHKVTVKAGFPFKVEGSHPPGNLDASYNVPNPVKPEDRGPKADKNMFTRIRIVGLDKHHEKKTIFINPFELKKYFKEQEDDYRSNPSMPGENVPAGEIDPKYAHVNVGSKKVIPSNSDSDTTQVSRPLRKAKPR